MTTYAMIETTLEPYIVPEAGTQRREEAPTSGTTNALSFSSLVSSPAPSPAETHIQGFLDDVQNFEEPDIEWLNNIYRALAINETLHAMAEQGQDHSREFGNLCDEFDGIMIPEMNLAGRELRWNAIKVGFMWTIYAGSPAWAQRGCPTIYQMCHQYGIADRDNIDKIVLTYSVWPYLHGLGYHIKDLIDGSLDLYKIGLIRQAYKNENSQLAIAAEEMARQRYRDRLTADASPQEVKAVLKSLPEEELTRVKEQAKQLHVAQAHANVEHIRSVDTADLREEERKQVGIGTPPTLLLTGQVVNGHFIGVFDLPMGFEETTALKRGQVYVRGERVTFDQRQVGQITLLLKGSTREQNAHKTLFTLKELAEEVGLDQFPPSSGFSHEQGDDDDA